MGIYMGKNVVEERGRVVIPIEMRRELNMKPGQEIIIEKKDGCIVIKPAINLSKFSEELQGCIKKSKIRPIDIKNIWHM